MPEPWGEEGDVPLLCAISAEKHVDLCIYGTKRQKCPFEFVFCAFPQESELRFLPFLENKGIWMPDGGLFLPSVLTRVQVCTHMRCAVSCHPSLWVESHSSLFVSDSAQSTPLTVYPLKGGQRQGTGSWGSPFFMIGSRPANYVK